MSSSVMATQKGVGMLEFLVALLIFSTGMMGLLSAQLAGKKTIFEASQRSVAITLARDMVERMRANPGQLAAYQVEGIGAEANQQQPPVADCHASLCSPAQLAAFDLWEWESLLRGTSEQDAAGKVGGLLSPRACISSSDGAVEVTLSWRGVLADGPASTNSCGDEGMGEVPPTGGEAVRHQLTLATFVVKR